MKISFSKLHGLGNDYIVIDETGKKTGLAEKPALIRKICRRGFGVGADGVLFVLPGGRKADFRMRMFNPDGTEAEMCGNGIRCFGKFVFDNGLTGKKELTVETLAGIKKLSLRLGKIGNVESVVVDMGRPVLERGKIPVAGNGKQCVEEELEVDGKKFVFTAVSMGNPHAIIFCGDKELEHENVGRYGPLIEHNRLFPNRINVEFVKVISPTEARMVVWERGAGITAACGTGTCATVVAGVLLKKFAPDKWVAVHLDGGDLKIRVDEKLSRVEMDGPAEHVFDGTMTG